MSDSGFQNRTAAELSAEIARQKRDGVGVFDSRFAPETPCTSDGYFWAETADAEGDTCNCGAWYRFRDRIERLP